MSVEPDVAVRGVGRHGVTYWRVTYVKHGDAHPRRFLYERVEPGAPTGADLQRICAEHEAASG